MKKNRPFRTGAALALSLFAYMIALTYFVVRRTSRFIVRRYSFMLSCLLTICAVGMLYNSIVTDSPVKSMWVTCCIGIVTLAVGANCYIWKED